MTLVRPFALAIGLLGTAVVSTAQAQKDDYCATQPPPKGLVERCQSRVIVVPDNVTAFRFILSGWMNTCVSSDRGVGLVHSAESVEKVWDLVKDLPATSRVVTIIPEYEPLKFTKDGKTCYGVKSVEFDVKRTKGTVDPGEPVIEYKVTDQMIKSAATAAKRALANSNQTAELKRFLGVLDGLEQHGEKFDDTYYPVAPLQDGGAWNPYACFKEYRVQTGRYDCLPGSEALKTCERHLAVDLVTSHHFDKVTPQRFAEILEIKANEIQRGVTYLLLAQTQESGAAYCPGLRDYIKPKVGTLAKRGKMTLYGYY